MPQYQLPQSERDSLQATFQTPFAWQLLEDRDWFGGWTVMEKEDQRWIMRSRELAYMFVTLAGRDAVRHELVEGEAAKQLNLRYGFCLSDEKKAWLRSKLVRGTPALSAIIATFGPGAREAPLMAQLRRPGGIIERYHRVLDGGPVVIEVVPPNELIGAVDLLTGPAAFNLLTEAIGEAKREG